MAGKALLFLLAFMLLVTTLHAHAYAPMPTPKRAPMHPPVVAPIHHQGTPVPAPKRTPVYPPIVAPTHPQVPAPSSGHPQVPLPDQTGHRNHGDCGARCLKFCNPHHSKRMCYKVCVPCCDICKCVPGLGKSCNNWTQVEYYGKTVVCPQILLQLPIQPPK